MVRHGEPTTRFAVCIQSDEADLLTSSMIYQVLPDDTAAKSNYVRVIDNEGEDYLYLRVLHVPRFATRDGACVGTRRVELRLRSSFPCIGTN